MDLDALAAEYRELPGVHWSEPNGAVGDGDDVCLQILGTDHAYVFMRGGGDCPAGCNENQYWAFRVDAATTVTELGFYDNTLGMPPPPWWTELAECIKRL
ncbi:MAG: hypothetical protein IPK80_30710 [Nannocystis sp.]|nr:hypothetical protein [Nannocystis sp.]